MLLSFVLIFGVVFGLMLLGMRFMTQRQALADGELEEADDDGAAVAEQRVPQAANMTIGRPDGDAEPLSPKDEALARKLKQAGIALDPATYRTRVLRTALVLAIVGIVMGGLGVGGLLFGMLLGFGGWKGGDFYLDWRYNQRINEFMDQFTDALSVMANGVKSGQTVLQTLETISQDFNEPIQGEVTEVLQELRMGVPMDEALASWAERLPLEDLEIATTALIVQRQTGGNVAEILDTVATTIRERNKLFKQIRTLTTQGRMSGVVLSLLPVGLFLAMYLIAPERTGLLISHPIGMVLTAVGVFGISLGAYVIKRIVTIEV